MDKPYLVEELAINDSFISFCFQKSIEDVAYWENYLLLYPEEKYHVEEAKSIVLGISTMLHHIKAESKASWQDVANNDEQNWKEEGRSGRIYRLRRYAKYAATIAAAAVLLLGVMEWANVNLKSSKKTGVSNSTASIVNIYSTGREEKKVVWLPDSTKVVMNVKSTLRLAETFGRNDRIVYLDGEALFDVTHNKAKPFIVRMTNYEVKVLGTLFNVKSYPGDKTSETSLLRGKVEIVAKDNPSKKVILKPNEKAIVKNEQFSLVDPVTSNQQAHKGLEEINILPLKVNSQYNSIHEIAWVDELLEINNESFEEMKPRLERWYNVAISFQDDVVPQYRFTATFKNENIEQVLKALQLSYPFQYKLKNNVVSIGK
jgi:ferric-dicitrate binding protein FerR (iron transport regulator)